MIYAMEKLGISESTAHSRLNALKFYFEQVLGKKSFLGDTQTEETAAASESIK